MDAGHRFGPGLARSDTANKRAPHGEGLRGPGDRPDCLSAELAAHTKSSRNHSPDLVTGNRRDNAPPDAEIATLPAECAQRADNKSTLPSTPVTIKAVLKLSLNLCLLELLTH